MMKLIKEIEIKKTEIKAAIEELSFLQNPNHLFNPTANANHDQAQHDAGPPAPAPCCVAHDHIELLQDVSDIPTRPFLAGSHLILQILDKIGPTMAVLRQDMFQNIQRLEMRIDSDPIKYSNVVEILKQEAAEGNARDRHSCSRALLWLTRSLDFMVALLERIAKNPSQNMEEMVEESYCLTLKPWHGWISSAAYKVVLKLLPDNKTFIGLLSYKGQNFSTLYEEIQTLITLLMPMLDDIHVVLGVHGLDRLKCT